MKTFAAIRYCIEMYFNNTETCKIIPQLFHFSSIDKYILVKVNLEASVAS